MAWIRINPKYGTMINLSHITFVDTPSEKDFHLTVFIGGTIDTVTIVRDTPEAINEIFTYIINH